MDEKKETKGLQWIHKAIFLLLADVLTILFSYFAALLLRFDLCHVHDPAGVSGGIRVVHALLGNSGGSCILRLQAVS